MSKEKGWLIFVSVLVTTVAACFGINKINKQVELSNRVAQEALDVAKENLKVTKKTMPLSMMTTGVAIAGLIIAGISLIATNWDQLVFYFGML